MHTPQGAPHGEENSPLDDARALLAEAEATAGPAMTRDLTDRISAFLDRTDPDRD